MESPLLWDLIELAGHLRQERLFVLSEQSHLQDLNEKVVTASSKLAQVAWVTAQQRVNLNRLVLSCPDATPAMCCRRATALESTQFIDAHKVLGYQNCSSYGDLLENLRDSPRLIADCLLAGDRLLPDEMPGVIQSLVAGLYASCVLPHDKIIVLQVLSHLITLQLLPSEYPRRLLRQGSCAFSRLYSSFHEGLFSGKLFLTAALHTPIMHLLMLEEKHLDIDPDKAAMRLSPREKLRRFGVEGSEEYKVEMDKHRKWTISNLVAVTKNFINSLHENMHCFPSSLCWLVGQIYARLTNGNRLSEKEVFSMCTDLVFTMFICPAIVTPEPYGIMDAPISTVARFNLIQVAQILQMLAMWKYQPIDPKVEDLYSQFEKDCVSSIIDAMIEGSIVSDSPQVGDNMVLQGLCRSAALFTESELHSLVSFLRTVANEANCEDTKLQKELSELLRQVPEQIINGHSKPVTPASPDVPPKKHNILSKASKIRAHNGNNGFDISPEDDEIVGEKVLVVPFSTSAKPFLGLDSEQKILAMEKEGEADRTARSVEAERQERVEGQEKRTRFSLSHDDGSIGNTSDNLEVVSEAPSNHSVASSLELETEDQNDNLSDMVSANVSGRGSPNISGRDTPSSQITEGDEVGPGGSSTRQQLDFNPPPPPNKHSRFDIDDKFGKFEIKTLIEGTSFFHLNFVSSADETVSLVSDTWSTDVLASDSETVEQPMVQTQISLPDQQQLPGTQLMDVSETASEAWSTDVVASDSERLTEVDTDDTASVARSDDTGRSEVESRGEPETVEDPQPSHPSLSAGSSFRSIREEVRGSPTRADGFGGGCTNSAGVQLSSNSNSAKAPGGSKAGDYRRKTLEYMDGNRNIYSKPVTEEQCRMIHILETPSRPPSDSVKPVLVAATSSPTHSAANSASANQQQVPLLSAVLPPGNSDQVSPLHAPPPVAPTPLPRLHTRTSASHHLPSQEISTEEADSSVTACFSTASVASSTSSGSSLETRSTNPELTMSGPPLVMQNGSVVLEGSSPLAKPNTSTGAIPKSISFDKTAERGDKESMDDDNKHKKSFFRNFKLPFKNRRGKSLRGADCYESTITVNSGDMEGYSALRLRRGLSEDNRASKLDTSDDILAKYRRKPNSHDSEEAKAKQQSSSSVQADISRPADVSRSITTYPFDDAKKKLRLVLSTAEIQQIPDTLPLVRKAWVRKENELVAFLQLQLAEAINLQDRSLIPHLHETLRCIKMFSERECRSLFESLKEDYKNRAPYVSYLVKCRQALLSTSAHLERLLERVKCDRRVVLEFLSAACVRIFLEKRENQLAKFCSEFQSLTLADEKNDLLDGFLHTLILDLERDPIWHSASEAQINQARTAVERAVFSRVYVHAMYPNGEGDICRDQVLQEHMAKLGKVVTPNHKDLRIPKMFHQECPWLSAQAEVNKMAAYRTPRDKLQCVLRCTTTIMNLLSLACVPAADDLMPVLVYVVIMANPPSLLSTLEYVSSFYGNRLEGEEQYYWTQFCSAIEFIKTMDYIVCE